MHCPHILVAMSSLTTLSAECNPRCLLARAITSHSWSPFIVDHPPSFTLSTLCFLRLPPPPRLFPCPLGRTVSASMPSYTKLGLFVDRCRQHTEELSLGGASLAARLTLVDTDRCRFAELGRISVELAPKWPLPKFDQHLDCAGLRANVRAQGRLALLQPPRAAVGHRSDGGGQRHRVMWSPWASGSKAAPAPGVAHGMVHRRFEPRLLKGD